MIFQSKMTVLLEHSSLEIQQVFVRKYLAAKKPYASFDRRQATIWSGSCSKRGKAGIEAAGARSIFDAWKKAQKLRARSLQCCPWHWDGEGSRCQN